MSRRDMRRFLFLGLALAVLSVAPAPPQPTTKAKAAPSPQMEARYKAAVAQYELEWSYYQQSRTDSFMVYYWSRLVLDSERDMSGSRDARIAAVKAHDDRMRKLQELIAKVRKLGFARSSDVGATTYYRLEADRWLELEQGGAE